MKKALSQRPSSPPEASTKGIRGSSARFYESLFQQLSEAVFTIKGGKIQWCNDKAEELFGYSRRELQGKSVNLLYPNGTADKEELGEYFRHLNKGGPALKVAKLKAKNGRVVEVEMKASTLGDAWLSVAEIVMLVKRSSATRDSRAGFSKQGREVAAILSNMTEGVVIENGEYEVEFMNDALLRRFGDQVGRKCYRAFIGRNRPCSNCSVREVIHKGKKRFEYTAVDKNGRSYELVATPLKNEDGTISVIEVIRDVTDKKAAEDKLKREKELSESIVQSIADGVVTLDIDGGIVSCNEAMRKKLGISAEQILGKKIWDVLRSIPKAKWRKVFQQIKQTEKPFKWGTVRLQDSRGEEIANIKSVPLKDNAGKLCGTIHFFDYITEKIIAEKKLKEAKKFYEILLRDIGEGVIVLKDHKMIWCNRRVEEMTGYSQRELIGRSLARLFPGRKSYKEFSEVAYGVLSRRNRYDTDVQLRRKNGEVCDVEFSLSAMRRAEGGAEIIAVGRYISARKRAEKEDRERARRLAILNKVTTKIGSSIQLKDVLHFITKSILKLTGLDSCSIVLYDESTKSLQDYVSIGLNENFQKSLKWRLRPGGVTEWVVKHKEPLVIPNTTKDPRSVRSRATQLAGVQATAALPILSKGRVIGLMFVNSFRPRELSPDLVSLISSIASQAAGALENAKLYKQVSEKVTELSALHLVGKASVSTLDVPDLLAEVVTVLHKSLGYNKCAILLLDKEKMELTIGAAYGVPPKIVKNLRIDAARTGITGWVARTGKPVYVPDVLKDSRYVPGIRGIRSELAVPLKRGDEVIGVLDVESKQVQGFSQRDLRVLTTVAAQTAMAIENAKLFEQVKRAYEDLKTAQADVVQAGKMAAVGQLAAGIAHELNNPIGGILGYAQFALSKIQALNGKGARMEGLDTLEHYLGNIERESDRCRNIVQNLLNFSRTSHRGCQRTDVNKILGESLQFMEHNLSLNNILVFKKLSRKLPPIFGDGNQLQQVFVNLILNAQKAMAHGGTLRVTTRKAQSPDRSKVYVEATVSDTGCGISKENLPHIFEPFFTTRKIGEGTGLGLSVSYRIIKNHGGEILVDSRLNRGTTFVVRLPVNGNLQKSTAKDSVKA